MLFNFLFKKKEKLKIKAISACLSPAEAFYFHTDCFEAIHSWFVKNYLEMHDTLFTLEFSAFK